MIDNRYSFRFVILISAIFMILNISCKNETVDDQKKIESNITGVIITDKSIMRIDPIVFSSVVTYLNKGDKVMVIDRSREKDRLNNNEDYWYNIVYSHGFTGWIYGSNIKIFPSKDGGIERFISGLQEEELINLRKKLSGKWGFAENKGALPEQRLEIYDDGKYKSYRTESDGAIEGEYSVNFKESEIVFKSGTYFGNTIAFQTNSKGYILKRAGKGSEFIFKKISSKTTNSADEDKKEKIPGA